jgi:hypothetical protein
MFIIIKTYVQLDISLHILGKALRLSNMFYKRSYALHGYVLRHNLVLR